MHPEISERTYAAKTADQRRAERRERLMAAGLELFGSDGYRTTTIEALCAAANVSTRNLYEEFGSREALMIALHDDVNARALDAVGDAIAQIDDTDVRARISAGTAAYLLVMTSDRRWARIALIESVGASPQAEAHRRAAIDRFVMLIEAEAERLSAAGVIESRDFHLMAIAVAGALNGLVSSWTVDDDLQTLVPRIAHEATRLITLAFLGHP